MYICICSGITDKDIEEACNKIPLETFVNMTGATQCCGTCRDTVKDMFKEKTNKCNNKIICQNI